MSLDLPKKFRRSLFLQDGNEVLDKEEMVNVVAKLSK